MPSLSDKPDEEPIENSPISTDAHVTITKAQWDELRARVASIAVADPNRSEAPATPRGNDARDLSEKVSTPTAPNSQSAVRGTELDQQFQDQGRRLADLERTCKSAVRDRELATHLAGRALVPGAVAQLTRLWRDELDVIDDHGEYHVVARDGRTVAQAVSEWLDTPDYAHFCLPSSRGGTGAKNANRPGGPSGSIAAPKNLGEAIVTKWREESARRPDSLLKPIGLRRHR